jgi:hypothetical protein
MCFGQKVAHQVTHGDQPERLLSTRRTIMRTWKPAKGTHQSLLILTILGSAALATGAATPTDASAGIRFRARINTPNLSVGVGNAPHRSYGRVDYDWRYNRRHNPRPIARPHLRVRRSDRDHRYNLSREDRRIARRLAKWTGYSKHELLNLRSDGYRWFEVGRLLDIRPGTVRAAVNGTGRGHGRYRERYDDRPYHDYDRDD